ncbi:MLP-like protein 43 [Carica papaya]|uniref:MLP-like protein 43 n=1 Tax=Carica papaya TaxID=3649 RepID=UPI000B8C8985|nr:MLP-like protein 43 [Carica papaya]
MSMHGKLEAHLEIKASAEKFHEIFTHRPHHISNVSTDKIHGCDLHEGDWGTVGSIVYWNYFHDGKKKVAKEIVEAIDVDKNLIKFKVIEGDLMEEYKSFSFTIQVTPKENGEGSTVHWLLEYEKISDEVAHPETLLDFCIDVSKELDAHLIEQA